MMSRIATGRADGPYGNDERRFAARNGKRRTEGSPLAVNAFAPNSISDRKGPARQRDRSLVPEGRCARRKRFSASCRSRRRRLPGVLVLGGDLALDDQAVAEDDADLLDRRARVILFRHPVDRDFTHLLAIFHVLDEDLLVPRNAVSGDPEDFSPIGKFSYHFFADPSLDERNNCRCRCW